MGQAQMDDNMPSTPKPGKVERKINFSSATLQFAEELAEATETPLAELLRVALERGLTAIAEDENKRQVWFKLNLRGKLGRLVGSLADSEMKAGIEVLSQIQKADDKGELLEVIGLLTAKSASELRDIAEAIKSQAEA